MIGAVSAGGKKRAGGGAAPWYPTDLASAPVILDVKTGLYTIDTGIDAVTNQGTAGNAVQATGGAQPDYVANRYGSGLHAMYLDGAARLVVPSFTWPAKQIEVWAGIEVEDAAVSRTWFASTNHWGFAKVTAKTIRTYYDGEAGPCSSDGTTDLVGAVHVVRTVLDIDASFSAPYYEIPLYEVDGGANEVIAYNANNNTADHGASKLVWGDWHDEAANYPFKGWLSFLVIPAASLTGADQTAMRAWALARVGL
jgi:hypothetical protein